MDEVLALIHCIRPRVPTPGIINRYVEIMKPKHSIAQSRAAKTYHNADHYGLYEEGYVETTRQDNRAQKESHRFSLYYRIYNPNRANTTTTPLVVLHGGP